MTDFKDVKRALYSVPIDVRNFLDVLDREVDNYDDELRSKQEISDKKVENQIYNADAIIASYLSPLYGESALSVSTPYTKSIVPAKGNVTSVDLNGVIVGASAITEQWVIKFTSDDTFTLFGSCSGSQGSGDIASDFTCTNGDIQIMSADWLNPAPEVISEGNQFIFATYISNSIVNTLSAMLATSFLIDAIYSTSDSEETIWGRKMYSKSMKILRDLADENSAASLGSSTEANIPNFQTTAYEIDVNGADKGEYDTITDDYAPFND